MQANLVDAVMEVLDGQRKSARKFIEARRALYRRFADTCHKEGLVFATSHRDNITITDVDDFCGRTSGAPLAYWTVQAQEWGQVTVFETGEVQNANGERICGVDMTENLGVLLQVMLD